MITLQEIKSAVIRGAWSYSNKYNMPISVITQPILDRMIELGFENTDLETFGQGLRVVVGEPILLKINQLEERMLEVTA